VQGPEYAEFWAAYRAVKEQNVDILQKSLARKEAVQKRAKAAEERKAGKDAAMDALAVKGSPVKSAGVSKKTRPRDKFKARIVKPDDDGDVEME
jgi:hypothetical protein